MRYDLQDIWRQALDDDFATDINGQGYESRLVYGVKIIRDNVTKEVQILKAMTGSEYYPKLSKDEIEVFLDKGWRYGIAATYNRFTVVPEEEYRHFTLPLTDDKTKIFLLNKSNSFEKKFEGELPAQFKRNYPQEAAIIKQSLIL